MLCLLASIPSCHSHAFEWCGMMQFSGMKKGIFCLKKKASFGTCCWDCIKELSRLCSSSCSGPAFHQLPQHRQFPTSTADLWLTNTAYQLFPSPCRNSKQKIFVQHVWTDWRKTSSSWGISCRMYLLVEYILSEDASEIQISLSGSFWTVEMQKQDSAEVQVLLPFKLHILETQNPCFGQHYL